MEKQSCVQNKLRKLPFHSLALEKIFGKMLREMKETCRCYVVILFDEQRINIYA